MVMALEQRPSIQKARSFNFRNMFEIPGKSEGRKLEVKCGPAAEHIDEQELEEKTDFDENSLQNSPVSNQDGAEATPRTPNDNQPSETEQMKERFCKLLLGEDMSGGGKGVSSALALSNAITNLAASVFGEQSKLQPMSPERKAKWRTEMDWLLSVADHIVELVPSIQQLKDGAEMEIMVTRQRSDLLMNIPALRKLDAMLIGVFDNFGEKNNEFWYEKNTAENDDKWWHPTCRVPESGLSESSRRWLQFQKDIVNQVLKAALAINAQVLSEMAVPDSYIESLPKHGRASLGDSIYKSITVELFEPEQFLSTMDLSTEHKVEDLKNKIEASIVIWKRKMHKDGRSSWSISFERRELFEERAETILLILKQRFPGIAQSFLDVSKIEHNMDVGHAILEGYSRVLESLAFRVMSSIEDVLQADTNQVSVRQSTSVDYPANHEEEVDTSQYTPRTLSEIMGWSSRAKEKDSLKKESECHFKGENDKTPHKSSPSAEPKRRSYLEKLEILTSVMRSPSERH